MKDGMPRLSPNADTLIALGRSYMASKTLLVAVSLGVFSQLSQRPLEYETLRTRLGLHPRGARDFLDALVALGLLQRRGPYYANTPETELYLDKNKPSYIGGWLELSDSRLYGHWSLLADALRTGDPQNEAKHEEDYYANLCDDSDRLRTFLWGMTGLSIEPAKVIAKMFPWGRYQSFLDLGGAQGTLSVRLALSHPHLSGGSFDLPAVKPFFERYVESFGLENRLTFYPGDFFIDPLPQKDVLVMGHILHNWSLDEKRMLISRAFDALAEGGALVIYEEMIDDDRRWNADALLMSLNMLLATKRGFASTWGECESWLKEAGFRDTSVQYLVGSEYMVVGTK